MRTVIRDVSLLVVFGCSLPAISLADSPANNNHNYSLNRQISLDPSLDSVEVEGETEAIQFYYSDVEDIEDYNPMSESTRSNMFVNGGEQIPFVAMAECAFGLVSDSDVDEDEDDDDDDDDGHSSMLSNASLRRTALVSAGARVSPSHNSKLTKPISKATERLLTPANAYQSRPSIQNSLFELRGGASLAPSSELSKRLIVAALVTLMYEGSIGHILEFLKIAMQTAPIGTSYLSILKAITADKGIVGAWDGFIPWGVVQAIAKGGVFGIAHAAAKNKLLPFVEQGVLPKQAALTLAGGIAGGFQGFVLSPTLLLKTRVMTNPVFRERMSLLKTTLLSFSIGFDVVAKEGAFALMKGSNIFALKRVFDWSTRYYFSDMFEALMLSLGKGVDGVLSPGEKILASLLGGTASTIVTLPLDVIVAKSQDAKKAGVKVSALDTFMKDYKEGGLKGLYDANMMGFEARLLHVCFTTVAMKTGTALMYDYLYNK